VANGGPSDARSVEIDDLLSPGLSGATYAGSGDPASHPYASPPALGDVEAGGPRIVTITAHVGANVPKDSTRANPARGASSTDDPNSGNDTSAVVDTHVSTEAAVADLKVADTSTVVAGTHVTYTITVSNTGPSDAQAVSLADALDSSLTAATYCTGAGCD